MLEQLNIRYYSYQVKKQLYRTNGVRVMIVIVSAMRAAREDRFRRSCFSDETLSKH